MDPIETAALAVINRQPGAESRLRAAMSPLVRHHPHGSRADGTVFRHYVRCELAKNAALDASSRFSFDYKGYAEHIRKIGCVMAGDGAGEIDRAYLNDLDSVCESVLREAGKHDHVDFQQFCDDKFLRTMGKDTKLAAALRQCEIQSGSDLAKVTQERIKMEYERLQQLFQYARDPVTAKAMFERQMLEHRRVLDCMKADAGPVAVSRALAAIIRSHDEITEMVRNNSWKQPPGVSNADYEDALLLSQDTSDERQAALAALRMTGSRRREQSPACLLQQLAEIAVELQDAIRCDSMSTYSSPHYVPSYRAVPSYPSVSQSIGYAPPIVGHYATPSFTHSYAADPGRGRTMSAWDITRAECKGQGMTRADISKAHQKLMR